MHRGGCCWLHAPERIRPVTIDLRAEPGGFEKTLLCCKNTAGGFDGIAAGFRGELAWGSHLFADLSWIPASAKIHSAVLTLTQQFSAEDADFYWRLNTGWQSIIEFPKENGHVFCLDVTESVKRRMTGANADAALRSSPKRMRSHKMAASAVDRLICADLQVKRREAALNFPAWQSFGCSRRAGCVFRPSKPFRRVFRRGAGKWSYRFVYGCSCL